MLHNESQVTHESPWKLIKLFHFLTNAFSHISTWFFLEQVFIFEDNETGFLIRDYLEKKDFFARLSSGWVGLHFGYKVSIIGGVCFAGGMIGIVLAAPIMCLLFALSSMLGVHTLLVAHEHHRRTLAQSMVKHLQCAQKNLEAQQEVFEQAHKKACGVASQLEGYVKVIDKGTEEIKQEVSEIRQHKEEMVVVIAKVDSLVEEVQKSQNDLTVTINKNKDAMKHLDDAADKGIDCFNQLSNTVFSLKQSVNGFEETHSKYAHAVSEFGLFKAKKCEKSSSDKGVEYNEQLKDLIAMLDEANKRMVELNSGSRSMMFV